MHLVKNLVIRSSPENSVFASQESNPWETISGQSSPYPTTNTPRSNFNCPPGFSTADAYDRQRGSQKHEQFLITGWHTTSVSDNNQRCWRSQPHAKATFSTTASPASSPTTQRTINFAPTQTMMNKFQILNSSYIPITNRSHSISSPLNLCFSPTTNYRRAPITTKPKPKEKPLPQSPLPGMYFWQRTLPHDPQKVTWSFHKYDVSEEYIILKETAVPIFNFIVKDLSTGK